MANQKRSRVVRPKIAGICQENSKLRPKRMRIARAKFGGGQEKVKGSAKRCRGSPETRKNRRKRRKIARSKDQGLRLKLGNFGQKSERVRGQKMQGFPRELKLWPIGQQRGGGFEFRPKMRKSVGRLFFKCVRKLFFFLEFVCERVMGFFFSLTLWGVL